MITISKDDFNRELESYIDKRTSRKEKEEVQGFMKKLFGRDRKSPSEQEKRSPAPEEKDFEEEPVVFEEEDDGVDEFDEMDEDFYERDRQHGFFRRLIMSFRGKDSSGRSVDEEFYEEEVSYEVDSVDEEQVKEFLKELHPWLESFEPRTMQRFKQSTAFKKYRELLEELDMIQK